MFTKYVTSMAEFKRKTALQKDRLQVLTEAVKDYLQVIEIPYGSRHRKTTLTLSGDRFRPVDIVCRYVTPKRDL